MTTAKKTARPTPTAKAILSALTALHDPSIDNTKNFAGNDPENKFLHVRMGNIFLLAKEWMHLPLKEIEILLENNFYEARVAAVAIMDFLARDKKIDAATKKKLYELYLKRHDRINTWDLVDRSATWVIGAYLLDKPRAVLYKLAKSKDPWERRTAIVATTFFLKHKQTEDTFAIGELLVHDKNEYVNKAVGSWVREAGKQDPQRLLAFLDKYAATMPRITLRYAVEKLDKKTKDRYMKNVI